MAGRVQLPPNSKTRKARISRFCVEQTRCVAGVELLLSKHACQDACTPVTDIPRADPMGVMPHRWRSSHQRGPTS